MSVWKRIRTFFGRGGEQGEGGDPGEEGLEPLEEVEAGLEAEARGAARPGTAVLDPPLPGLGEPEARLAALGDRPRASIDAEEVVGLLDRVVEAGREARAIVLARRVLEHHPDLDPVVVRTAEILFGRGDEEGAAELLRPLTEDPEAALDVLVLAAEVAERRGDPTGALWLYERVLARDLDYPRVRSRVARLREGERRGQVDVGATLMADGALTRGRYEVRRELGRGGAGTVFLATDRELGRAIALKVYHRRGRAQRARLISEARTAASFEHPGIVRIFDLDEELAAIAMELLSGSVRAELNRGSVELTDALLWLRSGAAALARVHTRGIVHRDIKPSNFLLRERGRVVLTDFGVATPEGREPRPGEAAGEGTLAYMPPEQRGGGAARRSMDLYAFGTSMREILAAVEGPIPAPLPALIDACVALDPDARPHAEDVARSIAQVIERDHPELLDA